MLSRFMELKEVLVWYLDRYGEDGEINYLLNLVDCFVSGKISFDAHVFYPLKEEICVISTFHKNKDFLKVVEAFDKLQECLVAESELL